MVKAMPKLWTQRRWLALGAGLMLAVLVVAAQEAASLKQMITDLGAERYAAREAAEAALVKLGSHSTSNVLNQCVLEYSRTKDPEVRSRLESVMRKLVETQLFKPPRGFLGAHIHLQNLTLPNGTSTRAIHIVQVTPEAAAQRAGLQAGDWILKVNDLDTAKLSSSTEFIQYISRQQPGEKARVTISRDGEQKAMDVTIGETPPDHPTRQQEEEQKQMFFQEWWVTQFPRQATAP